MTTTPNPATVTTSDAERAAVLLSDTDLRRIYTRVMGGNRFDGNELMLMREVEHAVNEKHGAALPIDFKQATDQGGWQLVPKEPTDDMLLAAEISGPRGYGDLYVVMLAAAPTLQGVADGDAA